MAQFTILTVCSGNICRSPLAEQLLRAGARAWPEVAVASAGTTALVGEPMTEQAQALSREFGGIGAETHRARDLTGEQLRDADLVFALSREHRRAIVELYPRATRLTFTLREFARLVAGVTDADFEHGAQPGPTAPVARLTELVEVAASRRGLVEPPDSPSDDNVIDPYRQPDEVYRQCADQLVPAVNTVLSQFARATTVGSR